MASESTKNWMLVSASIVAVVALFLAAHKYIENRHRPAQVPDLGEITEQPDTVDLILLESRPRSPDAKTLAAALSKATGHLIIPSALTTQPSAAEGTVEFTAKVQEMTLHLQFHAGRYDAVLPDNVPDAKFKDIILNHKAWLSVEVIDMGDHDPEQAYRLIGRLLAVLSDDATLAVLAPDNQGRHLGAIFNPKVQAALVKDPLDALYYIDMPPEDDGQNE